MSPALFSWLLFAALVPALAWAWSSHLRIRALEQRVDTLRDSLLAQVVINREQTRINAAIVRQLETEPDGVLWTDRVGNVRGGCQ